MKEDYFYKRLRAIVDPAKCMNPDTCLYLLQQAENHPEMFSDEFRTEILRGDYLCHVCKIKKLVNGIDL